MSVAIKTQRYSIVTHTCRQFPLHSRSEWTVAEGCEAVSPLARFDVTIVSIDQDLAQSFALSAEIGC